MPYGLENRRGLLSGPVWIGAALASVALHASVLVAFSAFEVESARESSPTVFGFVDIAAVQGTRVDADIRPESLNAVEGETLAAVAPAAQDPISPTASSAAAETANPVSPSAQTAPTAAEERLTPSSVEAGRAEATSDSDQVEAVRPERDVPERSEPVGVEASSPEAATIAAGTPESAEAPSVADQSVPEPVSDAAQQALRVAASQPQAAIRPDRQSIGAVAADPTSAETSARPEPTEAAIVASRREEAEAVRPVTSIAPATSEAQSGTTITSVDIATPVESAAAAAAERRPSDANVVAAIAAPSEDPDPVAAGRIEAIQSSPVTAARRPAPQAAQRVTGAQPSLQSTTRPQTVAPAQSALVSRPTTPTTAIAPAPRQSGTQLPAQAAVKTAAVSPTTAARVRPQSGGQVSAARPAATQASRPVQPQAPVTSAVTTAEEPADDKPQYSERQSFFSQSDPVESDETPPVETARLQDPQSASAPTPPTVESTDRFAPRKSFFSSNDDTDNEETTETIVAALPQQETEQPGGAPASGSPLIDARHVPALLEHFGTNACLLIMPRLQEAKVSGFDAFGTQASATDVFKTYVTSSVGVEPDVSHSALTGDQCTAVNFIRDLPEYPFKGMRIELDQDVVRDGSTVKVIVSNIAHDILYLVIVDDVGNVHLVGRQEKATDTVKTFNLRISLEESDDDRTAAKTKQLLVAFAANDFIGPLDNMKRLRQYISDFNENMFSYKIQKHFRGKLQQESTSEKLFSDIADFRVLFDQFEVDVATTAVLVTD